MTTDSSDVRRAIRRLIVELQKAGFSLREFCTVSGISPGSWTNFNNGTSRTVYESTLERMATGATKLLGRTVTVAELRGEPPIERPAPLHGYAGAGAKIHLFAGDGAGPMAYIPVPPGLDDPQAVMVRGDSMEPRYVDGDILIYENKRLNPSEAIGNDCVVCTVDETMYIKRLEKGRKGRWRLKSLNPYVDDIENVDLLWAARIRWICRGAADIINP